MIELKENKNYVDVWYGDILLEDRSEKDFWAILNTSEREKAKAFARIDLQKKYIKTRGVLKYILSQYLQIEAQNVLLETAQYGKPFVTTGSEFYFNLSHQGNRFVVAVSNLSQLGIDIEQNRERGSLPDLVEKCFAKNEITFWKSLPEAQKTTVFYQFWVRKEAFVKAVGRGIALGLNQCVVDPENPVCFVSLPSAYGLAKHWKIIEVNLNKDDICVVVLKANKKFEFKKIAWK